MPIINMNKIDSKLWYCLPTMPECVTLHVTCPPLKLINDNMT